MCIGTGNNKSRGLSCSHCCQKQRTFSMEGAGNGFFSHPPVPPGVLPQSPASSSSSLGSTQTGGIREPLGKGRLPQLSGRPQGAQSRPLLPSMQLPACRWRTLLPTDQGRLKTGALKPDRLSLTSPNPLLKLHNPCFGFCPPAPASVCAALHSTKAHSSLVLINPHSSQPTPHQQSGGRCSVAVLEEV